jgi:hypothetical protein
LVKGLKAVPTSSCDVLQAAWRPSPRTSPSQTALAQSMMGLMAMIAPESNPASRTLANADLPRISPKTAQVNPLASLMLVPVVP